ncbi:MAG TPA: hypothetical protein VG759_22795, partial [Candidatus Angelobacter sp.]|nr:hypothetical protein [Candidatus Angelobacter sp.]
MSCDGLGVLAIPSKDSPARYVPEPGVSTFFGRTRNQEEHNRKFNYQEEILALLRKHGVEYDERYARDQKPLCRPLRGLWVCLNSAPTACAVGYVYDRPLRGLSAKALPRLATPL